MSEKIIVTGIGAAINYMLDDSNNVLLDKDDDCWRMVEGKLERCLGRFSPDDMDWDWTADFHFFVSSAPHRIYQTEEKENETMSEKELLRDIGQAINFMLDDPNTWLVDDDGDYWRIWDRDCGLEMCNRESDAHDPDSWDLTELSMFIQSSPYKFYVPEEEKADKDWRKMMTESLPFNDHDTRQFVKILELVIEEAKKK